MIKIATITTHGALNYGAVLQAYALSTYLNGAGYHCEILDYRPNYVKESYRLIKAPHSPSGVLLAGFQALHYQERKTRKQRFEQFQKEYLCTTYEKATQREELTALANEFDLLICGSDQIWNPKLHHFDEAYFLSYPEITVKRMAYAASFGQDSLDDDSKKEIARRIARIERFGCREFSAKKIVEELSGRDAEMVLDPVFLLSAETWRSVKKAFDHKDENYILGYFLSNPGHSIKAACSYAHSAGRKLYSIGFSPRDVGNDAVNCYDLGPQEFLSAVDDAEMVVTNSFHATAFSIIFHKQFFTRISSGADSRNDRMLSLLKQLGLEDRIFTDETAEIIDFTRQIDYEEVEKKLNELIAHSEAFLNSSIEEITVQGEKKSRITHAPCTACGACASSCPVGCIEIRKNSEGYYMPFVDEARCIDCGACSRVCPATQHLPGKDWKEGTYYAMWAKNPAERQTGSSGGIFGLLADEMLKQNGVVFGTAFSDDYKSVYVTSTEQVSLEALKKSKYVEGKTGTVFKDVKRCLEQGKHVLYCGTSCQIDGLKNYLKKPYPNLVTCDFLCHGVSAAGLYEKYISDLERAYGKIRGLSFRSKYYGWKSYCIVAEIENGRQYVRTRFQDPYLRMFFENVGLRENCFPCHRLEHSNADITIGDYWGVKNSPEIPDTNEGISLIGVHTEIGQEMVSSIRKNCEAFPLEQSKYEYAYKRHPYSMTNQKTRLRKLYQTESLFALPVTKKVALKGMIYRLRAQMQRAKIKQNRGKR